MHVFVDESRRGPTYVLASVRVSPAHLAGVRRGLRAALLGSQRRIHFVNESVARRRQLLASFARLPIEAIAYRAVQVPLRHEPAIRAELLRALIDDIVPTGATRLVIESRSGRDELDRRTIHDRLLIHRSSTLAYEHLLPTEDPLLWLADTFAWVAGAAIGPRGQPTCCASSTVARDTRTPTRKTRPLLVRGGTGSHFRPLMQPTPTSVGPCRDSSRAFSVGARWWPWRPSDDRS